MGNKRIRQILQKQRDEESIKRAQTALRLVGTDVVYPGAGHSLVYAAEAPSLSAGIACHIRRTDVFGIYKATVSEEKWESGFESVMCSQPRVEAVIDEISSFSIKVKPSIPKNASADGSGGIIILYSGFGYSVRFDWRLHDEPTAPLDVLLGKILSLVRIPEA